MRHLITTWRLTRVLVHGLHGLLVALLLFHHLDAQARLARVQWWSAKLLRLMGVSLVVHGQFRPGAKLVVANHVSWLDITAVHAICPEARFVSKADVKRWPLISRLVDAGGTLYIERDRKRDALRVVHVMTKALTEGDTVAVFPEGTTADGHALLPFHANLLQSAISSEVPIQPVALRYSEPGQAVSPAAMYVGDTSLAQSLGRIAGARSLCVTLHVLPAQSCGQADRRQLARHLGELIAHTLDPQPRIVTAPERLPRGSTVPLA
jgi:1-acyl-sn-glycerol-3-phosphate acyltransferase